jgi:hypothetical protein
MSFVPIQKVARVVSGVVMLWRAGWAYVRNCWVWFTRGTVKALCLGVLEMAC